jgi:Ca-activated chloride channel family protein
MSFASPLVLLALLLVPVAVARYVGGERRRRRAASEFASPRMMAAVAPVRPGWRRHLPLALYAIALTVLIIGAAKPRATVAVPVENAAIMLVTDVSGSMLATDVKPTRLVAARRAAQTFVKGVPHGVRIGVMAFNQAPRTLQAPTADRAEVRGALVQLASSGGTATGDALDSALTTLTRQPGTNGRRPPSAIVLLSDGASTRGRDPRDVATRAGRLKIPIYTVALGTPSGTITVPRPHNQPGTETRSVPPDPQTMIAVARASRGRAFTAEDADALTTVYDRLGSQLGTRKAKREITAAFVGGALALLAVGGALSLRWFGRLP